MNKRCEPGDLAVIVGRFKNSDLDKYIGQIAEVTNVPPNSFDWAIKGVGFSFPSQSGLACIRDCNLKPLRGNPEEQTETDVETAA